VGVGSLGAGSLGVGSLGAGSLGVGSLGAGFLGAGCLVAGCLEAGSFGAGSLGAGSWEERSLAGAGSVTAGCLGVVSMGAESCAGTWCSGEELSAAAAVGDPCMQPGPRMIGEATEVACGKLYMLPAHCKATGAYSVRLHRSTATVLVMAPTATNNPPHANSKCQIIGRCDPAPDAKLGGGDPA
jgi:hypothetical protein